MESQIKKLKLNVTNIKSHLIDSNKKLRKLQIRKTGLLSQNEKNKNIRKKESNVEKKNLGIGMGFRNITNAVMSPASNIFGKILEFAGLVLTGLLIGFVPDAMRAISSFFNSTFMKTVTGVLGGFVNLIASLGNLLTSPFSSEQKNKELEENLIKLSDDFDRDGDDLEKDAEELDKLSLSKFFSDETEDNNKTPNITPKNDNETPEKFSSGGKVKPKTNKDKSAISKSGTRKQRLANTGFVDFRISVDKMKNISIDSDKNMIKTFSTAMQDDKNTEKSSWWKFWGSDNQEDDSKSVTRSINWKNVESSKLNISSVNKENISSVLETQLESNDRDTVVLLAVKTVSEPMPIIVPTPVSNRNISVSSHKVSALWGRR